MQNKEVGAIVATIKTLNLLLEYNTFELSYELAIKNDIRNLKGILNTRNK